MVHPLVVLGALALLGKKKSPPSNPHPGNPGNPAPIRDDPIGRL